MKTCKSFVLTDINQIEHLQINSFKVKPQSSKTLKSWNIMEIPENINENI